MGKLPCRKMIKTLAYTATGVFLLAMIGAAIADLGSAHRSAPTQGATNSDKNDLPSTPGNDQYVGSALNLYQTDHLGLYLDAIDQMRATGFNALLVVTPVFQTDGASQEVRTMIGPGKGPSDTDIAALLNRAKSRGMRTVLMPQINFTDPRGNEWRGKLQPEHWAPWWQSYTKTIDRFLNIAIENDVDVFVVGCELLTTHKPEHEARWRELIAYCRERFDGQLIYSTTWDTYHKVGFWDDLDAVGVSGYWDLTTLAQDSEHPTPDELKRRWAQIKNRLLTFADTRGKPVLLTEVGYPSLPWALKDPWNYVNSDQVPADHDAQAAGYAAFIDAWVETISPAGARVSPDPRSLGVFFHKWDPYHQGGPDDSGYGILGKPAYQQLKHWLQGPTESDASDNDR
jgi:glycosyl hydrolase family 113